MTLPHRRCLPFALLASVATLLQPAAARAQGMLQSVRDEVRAEEPDRERIRYQTDEDAFHSDADDDSLASIILGPLIGGAVVLSVSAASVPYWGPVYWLDDDYGELAYFVQHPYQQLEESGLPARGPLFIDQTRRRPLRGWLGRGEIEYADDFDAISTISGRLLLDTTLRLGIDAEASYRRESLGAGRHDQLWTGDANLVLRFAQSEFLQFRSGLGANWLADTLGSDFGFNFTYGADWFPRQPWVVTGVIDLGILGNAMLVHSRLTAGVVIGRWEAYLGYDNYRVGSREIDGLVSGLKIWF